MALLASTLLVAQLGTCPLESGKNIENCQVGYRTFGQLNADKSNAVLIPTWFNGTSENLEKFIGPQGLVDSSKYFVIVADAFGNGVSSSPSNSETQRGNAFPRINIRDMVNAHRRLVTEKLGIGKLHAVIGISMGAMQTFEWMALYPESLEAAIPIVGTPKMSSKDILLWTSQLEKLNRRGEGNGGIRGILDMILNRRQNGQQQPEPASQTEAAFDLNAAPGTAGNAMIPMKPPSNVLRQFEAIVSHDIFKRYGGAEQAANRIRARTLIVVATQDKAVSPETPTKFASLIRAEVLELKGECGHKAYECELAALAPRLKRFLDQGGGLIP